MKIFISWSGERSEAQAKALREWLPLVLHFAEPWLSKSDIEAGERWSAEVAKELEACNFGVLCLTRDNLTSPWILFEAGALAKSIDKGRVIPLLFDLEFKEVSGPLSQFQSKKMDEFGVKELVVSLNKASKSPVPDVQLETLFGALWPRLAERLTEIPKAPSPAKHARPQGDILEDLVSTIRGLESRVRETTEVRSMELHSLERRFIEGIGMEEDLLPRRRTKRSDAQYFLASEVSQQVFAEPWDITQLVVLAAVLKQDIPWVYEISVEIVNLYRSGKPIGAKNLGRKLSRAIEIIDRAPVLDELGVRGRPARAALGDIVSCLDTLRKQLPTPKRAAQSQASPPSPKTSSDGSK